MAAECVHFTPLTNSMIKDKVLYFPTDLLRILPRVANERDAVEFPVSCGGSMYAFRCRKRRTGGSLRPVIQKGWSEVIKNYGLQEDDVIEWYYVAAVSDHEPARYWIRVRRCTGRHEDAMGTTWDWKYIV